MSIVKAPKDITSICQLMDIIKFRLNLIKGSSIIDIIINKNTLAAMLDKSYLLKVEVFHNFLPKWQL